MHNIHNDVIYESIQDPGLYTTQWLFTGISILLVLAGIIILCVRETRKQSRAVTIRWLAILVFSSVFFLVLLAYYVKIKSPHMAFLRSFLHMIKAIGGDGDFDSVTGIIRDEFSSDGISGLYFSDFYYVFLLILDIALPLLCGAAVLSLFKNLSNHILYFFSRGTIYIFSEINYDSGKVIRKLLQAGRTRNVFFLEPLDGKSVASFVGNEFAHRCLLIEKSEEEMLHYGIKKKSFHFFEISENEDKNLLHTIKLAEAVSATTTAKYSVEQEITVSIWSSKKDAEIIVNNLRADKLKIKLIDRDISIAYSLMFDHPLFEAADRKSGKLNILLLGSGKIGTEIVKAMSWAGKMIDIELHIDVIDSAADIRRNGLLNANLEAFEDQKVTIEYHKLNVNDDPAEEYLLSHCPHCSYIVVSLGTDDQNIATAIDLRTWYLRRAIKTGDHSNCKPMILPMVWDDTKADILEKAIALRRNDLQYDFRPFGTKENLLEGAFIEDSEIDDLALRTHAAYFEFYNEGESVDPVWLRKDYAQMEVNQRSNKAFAIHIAYKLWSIGLRMKALDKDEQPDYQLYLDYLDKDRNPDGMLRLMRLEHERWNQFERSEGYVTFTVDEVKRALQKDPAMRHRNDLARVHACISDFDSDLPEIGRIFNKDFVSCDEYLLKAIPDILSDKWGLGGKKYTIIRADN